MEESTTLHDGTKVPYKVQCTTNTYVSLDLIINGYLAKHVLLQIITKLLRANLG